MIYFISLFALSFLLCLLFYHLFLSKKRPELAQPINDKGPVWHKSKSGTPTFGGIIFVFVSVVLVSVFSFLDSDEISLPVFLLAAVSALLFGLIGFLDDFVKVHTQKNKGLSPWVKLMLQTVVSTLFVLVYRLLIMKNTLITLRLIGTTADLGIWTCIFEIFLIVGFVNGVNITDGIDGLAGSVSLIVFLFFGYVGQLIENTLVFFFSGSMCGSLLAFLVFNRHPARLFMGDTGSEYLGGLLAILAVLSNCHLIFFAVGIVFCIEILSDILQVTYKKITHGKKLFKMAPIHHTLELSGWSENLIVGASDMLTLFFCIVFSVLITVIQ